MKYFLILLLLSSVVSAKTYKCDLNGKKAYQMQPCSEGEGAEIDVIDKQPVVTKAEKAMRNKSDQQMSLFRKRRAAAQLAAETGVAVGMTKQQVRHSLGKPDKINSSQYGLSSQRDQWVYYHVIKDTRYIYFENGVVTSQQW